MKGGIARFSNRAPPEAAPAPAEEGKEEPRVEPQPDMLGGFDLNDFGAGEQNDGEGGVFFMAEDGAPGEAGESFGVFESVDPEESCSKDPSSVTTTTTTNSKKGQVSKEAASQPISRHTSTAATAAAAAALEGNIAVRFVSHQPFLP